MLNRSQLVSSCLCLGLVALAGCGNGGPVCYPVHGQVNFNHRPVAEALVIFHPLFASTETISRPLAYSDLQGNFVLTTVEAGDGALPGEYAITVELRDLRAVGEETVRDGLNLLPPQYADPRSTPLRFTVAAAPDNEVPPIQLER